MKFKLSHELEALIISYYGDKSPGVLAVFNGVLGETYTLTEFFGNFNKIYLAYFQAGIHLERLQQHCANMREKAGTELSEKVWQDLVGELESIRLYIYKTLKN